MTDLPFDPRVPQRSVLHPLGPSVPTSTLHVDYMVALTNAGLRVVEGNQWRERGAFLSEAAAVRVEYIGPDDSAAAIDTVKGSGAHGLVRRDGSVWLFAQALATETIEGDERPVIRVLVAADAKGKGKATAEQRDALAAFLAVIEAVAFDAAVDDEPADPPGDDRPEAVE